MDDRTTLDRVPAGWYAQIYGLPQEEGVRTYLRGLGLQQGAWVRVTYNPGRGPVVLRVQGRRVVLNREQARNLQVRVALFPASHPEIASSA